MNDKEGTTNTGAEQQQSSSQSITHFGAGMPAVLITTDGNTVTAKDKDGIIAEDSDTGAVLASVFDIVENAGTPQGRHIHFVRGEYPWHQSVTTSAVGLQITGEWNATRWNAESEIPWFVRFADEENGWILRGPVVSNLQYDGKGNADYMLRFDVVSNALVEQIFGTGTNEGMIYSKPDIGVRFNDHCWYRHLHVRNGGAVMVMESGEAGIPADCKVERCICLNPNSYGYILRDVHRIQIDRVFTGFGPNADSGDGGVLIENPALGDAPEAYRHTMGCQVNMAEVEDNRHKNDNKSVRSRAITVHIRSPEESSKFNHSHDIRHIRARNNQDVQFLKVESHGDRSIENVRLRGVMPAPNDAEDRIEIDGAVECDLEFSAIGGRSGDDTNPRNYLLDNGTRTMLNGVSHNEGNPADTGQWKGHGREGVFVMDTTTQTLFAYANGQWVPLSGGQ